MEFCCGVRFARRRCSRSHESACGRSGIVRRDFCAFGDWNCPSYTDSRTESVPISRSREIASLPAARARRAFRCRCRSPAHADLRMAAAARHIPRLKSLRSPRAGSRWLMPPDLTGGSAASNRRPSCRAPGLPPDHAGADPRSITGRIRGRECLRQREWTPRGNRADREC